MIASRQATDLLVDRLAAGLRPVPRAAIARRLGAGIAGGAMISTLLLVLVIGARPDLAEIVHSPRFWGKAGYMAATAALSLLVASRMARPAPRQSVALLLPVPWLLYALAAVWELASTPAADWVPLLLGHGWQLCTWLVLLLSLPIYAGLWWAFRSFAPTRMEAAGSVTGLCASAIAGLIYCLHCPTDTAVFALVWYGLAFAIAALVGRALGRRLFHW